MMRPDAPTLSPAYRAHIEKVLATAPPLNAEQRERIAALLRAGGGVR
jgi:hypothetical protein